MRIEMRPLALFALGALFLAASCKSQSELPGSRIYLLVDLSETWHNDASKVRNERVLREVGLGVSSATRSLSEATGRPISVQIRIIGQHSLARPPACDLIYERQLINTGNADSDRISDPRRLDEVLGTDCPNKLISMAPEALTEISSTLASVADEATIETDNRKIVILSDFLEEAHAPELPDQLSGFDILMVYRPMAEDQSDARGFRNRVQYWRSTLEGLGATTVEMVPDTAIKREVIADFLTRRSNRADGSRNRRDSP